MSDKEKLRRSKLYKRYAALGVEFKDKRSGVDGWARKSIAKILSYLPVMYPYTKVVQQWNKYFLVSCLIAIFIDPQFFFLLFIEKENKCVALNWFFGTAIAVVRSITDIIYLLHIVLQFRLAYVAPEAGEVGPGDLVDEPMKIALHYLSGYFFLDIFVVLPLPQVMILGFMPKYIRPSTANYAIYILRATVMLQYIPRLVRIFPLFGWKSASGFLFGSARRNFITNLLMFLLAGHVIGSFWYLFGLQRVNQCLRDTCVGSFDKKLCSSLIDCGRGGNFDTLKKQYIEHWINHSDSSNCLNDSGQFSYGIYQQGVLLTTEHSFITRYIYSLFWGFQQICTLAGNLTPSYFIWEVLFAMVIVGLGLLLFALLIGNLQNFLQALGRRRVEMQLRQRDVEEWMSNRRLPGDLRRRVRQAEIFNRAATQGLNEEELLSNFPEDIQRDIRHHFFRFLNKVRIFSFLDEPIMDAICEKLRRQLYVRGSDLLYEGGTVKKMVFIVRGKLECIGADRHVALLQDGDVCGEELITWYLEQHSSVHHKERGKNKGLRLSSTRTVKCLTNVEAFILRADDFEDVISLFSHFLCNPRVQWAIRYESPYWRERAAKVIKVAWRRSRRSEMPHNAPFRIFSIQR